MIRLIDADALKRRLIKRREEIASERRYGWEWEYNGLNCAILLTGCEAVENPIHPEPHWIPVTERLPKSKEEDLEYPTVLICFENEEVMLGCFYESTKEWGTGEYFDKKCNPIAWMPMPEPYKGVTE